MERKFKKIRFGNKRSLLDILFLFMVISGFIGMPTMAEAVITPASYIIYTDGTTYYAQNGQTGVNDYSGTNANTVIQSAINALANGGKIFIKKGTYTLTLPLYYTANLTLEGEGRFSTIFNATAITTDYALRPQSHASAMEGLVLKDFQINLGKDGIFLQDQWNPLLVNIEIRNGFGSGLIIDGGTYGTSGLISIGVFIRWCNNGVTFGVANPNGFISINKFFGGGFVGNVSAGIVLATEFGGGAGQGIATTYFDGVQIEANNWGARIGDIGIGVTNTSFINCFFDGNTTYDIMNFAGAYNTIVLGGLLHYSELYQAMPIKIKLASFATENSETATFSGNGSQKVFTFNHGLAGIPKSALVSAGSNGARNTFYVTYDATTITVTYGTAPPSGTNNVVLRWYAEM